MIAILDYGIGNLKSIYNMFKKIGVDAEISNDIDFILNADKYLLPGVGSFDHGIKMLRASNYFNIVENEVLIKKKPILGICLGMQLLTNSSEEGIEPGLGWIDAKTEKFKFEEKKLPVPHMGWNSVNSLTSKSIFKNLDANRFYFVHSYYVKCNLQQNILGQSNYGIEFTSSINRDNIFGVQFHPEKSHKYGMKLLENFSNL